MLTPSEIDEIRTIQAMCQMVLEKTRKLLPETQATKKKTKKQQIAEDMALFIAKRQARFLKQSQQ
jgi:hypothetical protein